MNKDLILSLVRAALTVAGSYLFGKNILGNPIDSSLWQEIIGIAISLGSMIWGIFDKTATVDAISSGIRSVAIFIGGLLVASGKLSADSMNSWLGLITTLITVILSATNRSQVKQLSEGTVKVETPPNSTTPKLVDTKKPK